MWLNLLASLQSTALRLIWVVTNWFFSFGSSGFLCRGAFGLSVRGAGRGGSAPPVWISVAGRVVSRRRSTPSRNSANKITFFLPPHNLGSTTGDQIAWILISQESGDKLQMWFESIMQTSGWLDRGSEGRSISYSFIWSLKHSIKPRLLELVHGVLIRSLIRGLLNINSLFSLG